MNSTLTIAYGEKANYGPIFVPGPDEAELDAWLIPFSGGFAFREQNTLFRLLFCDFRDANFSK